MSRWLYTFVVCSDPVLTQIASLMAHADSQHLEVQRVESLLLGALERNASPVAYFRMIMDGWNCTHERLMELGMVCCADLRTDLMLLSRQHWVQLSISEEYAANVSQEQCVDAEPGGYAVLAFRRALADMFGFMQGTHRPGIILCRCLGPSRDDRDYRPNII